MKLLPKSCSPVVILYHLSNIFTSLTFPWAPSPSPQSLHIKHYPLRREFIEDEILSNLEDHAWQISKRDCATNDVSHRLKGHRRLDSPELRLKENSSDSWMVNKQGVTYPDPKWDRRVSSTEISRLLSAQLIFLNVVDHLWPPPFELGSNSHQLAWKRPVTIASTSMYI